MTPVVAQAAPDRRLRFWRVVWLALAAVAVVLVGLGLAAYFERLLTVCVPDPAACPADAPAFVPNREQLAAVGLTPAGWAGLIVAIELAAALVYMVVAGVLFWRAPGNRIALLAAFFLLCAGITFTSLPYALQRVFPILDIPISLISFTGLGALYAFAALFPSGRFVPWWTRAVFISWLVLVFAVEFIDFNNLPENFAVLCSALGLILAQFASMIFAQVYRFLRVSTLAQRQQTKWVVLGLGVAITGFLGMIFARSFTSISGWPWGAVALFSLVDHSLFFAFLAAIPLSLMAAILQSRLWAIDLIIRRTLLYAGLTTALALVYFVSVFVLQSAFEVLTGAPRNELVTVLSTLALAALAAPIRARLQRAIDRRFYRRHYDAARTLAAFAEHVRDDVDLEVLVDRLLGVVDETMQPEHASVWMQPVPDAAERLRQAIYR